MTSETTPGLRLRRAVRLVAWGFHTKSALSCFFLSPPSVARIRLATTTVLSGSYVRHDGLSYPGDVLDNQ